MSENKVERLDTLDKKLIGRDHVRVLYKYPMLGHILSCMPIEITTKKTKTAAVSWNTETGQWNLLFNPDFYCKHDDMKTQEQRLPIWLHEAVHFICMHPVRQLAMMNRGVDVFSDKWNIAADIIVNEYLADAFRVNLRQLHPNACFYEKFNLTKEKDDTVEKVFKRLPENDKPQENQGDKKGGSSDEAQNEAQSGNGSALSGEHDKWGNEASGNDKSNDKKPLDKAELEKAEQAMREIVETAIQSHAEEWGNLPADMRNMIMATLRPKVKWTKHLRIFGRKAIKTKRTKSHRKTSRRYGFPYPGKAKKNGGKVTIGIDMSGSTMEYQPQFVSEIPGISKYAEVEVLPFDVRIVKVINPWKRGTPIPTTCGGTDVQCVFDYIAESKDKPNKVIILTDGEFDRVDTRGFPKKDILFVITPGGYDRPEGNNIHIDA